MYSNEFSLIIEKLISATTYGELTRLEKPQRGHKIDLVGGVG